MTDAFLMDADCIHDNVWWECDECEALMADIDMIFDAEDEAERNGGW